jgi:hypothetical protein
MKFPISNFPFPISRNAGNADALRPAQIGNWQLAIGNARGMALIITLILLSVTLIMAVAFLALARRERNAVTVTTDTTVARLATDSALAAAEAQMAANILATTNRAAYDYHVFSSQNYINPLGFLQNSANPTNVNYEYLVNGNPLGTADMEQNIANLWLLPRAPVLRTVDTANPAGRFYLDLNRNGLYERSGNIAETNSAYLPTGNTATNFAGDPEWVGVLEHPDQPHGPNNHFVSRYAFLAQPIGNSLDLNFIHNQAFTKSLNYANDGYFRNQGVGSWELNLAAFLADLNTNVWGQFVGSGNGAPLGANNFYLYNTALTGFGNQGVAFNDALSLLAWRYWQYSSAFLPSVNQLFGNAATFKSDSIDGYTDGPLQTTVDTNADFVMDDPSLPWPGADNTNRFFTLTADLYDANKSSALFTNRLFTTGVSNSTYDRYTFYRLLDQLGTDAKADAGKLNVNYSNAVVNYDANGLYSGMTVIAGAETNLVPWMPTNFFNAAADLLLRAYTTNWFQADPTNYFKSYFGLTPPGQLFANGVGVTNLQYFGQLNEIPAFGLTNIPVYVGGRFVYSTAVNRLLQLAANIYDAGNTNWYPTVFRPVFQVVPNGTYHDVFIRSYQQVLLDGTPYLATPQDVETLAAGSTGIFQTNVFGVPWILGAKKGLPNFQMAAMVNNVQVTRKLLATRTTTNTSGVYSTWQKDMFSITNNISISFWNSYSNDYVAHNGKLITVFATNLLDMAFTNNYSANNILVRTTNAQPFSLMAQMTRWSGSHWPISSGTPVDDPDTNAFIYANWHYPLAVEQAYDFSSGQLAPETATYWQPANVALPPFGLLTTNRLQAFILDGTQVLDYVQLRGPSSSRNLSNELASPNYPDKTGQRYFWSVNRQTPAAVQWGVSNQIIISKNNSLVKPTSAWKSPSTFATQNGFTTPDAEARYFSAFFTGIPAANTNGILYSNNDYTNQAPYTPVRTIYDYTLWQANDPLVHYLPGDLQFVGKTSGNFSVGAGPPKTDMNLANLEPDASTFDTKPGDRYQPWGLNTQIANNPSTTDPNAFNAAIRDPLVWGSDYWNFPTNPLPTIGWLGRVHRGTPWQTVYLKSDDILPEVQGGVNVGTNTWVGWTGNQDFFDATNSAPIKDRLLFDLFTTRFNDNAARGTLSVNQQNLAAWSAVFAGLVVPKETGGFTVIDPAGPTGPGATVGLLVSNINSARQTFTNTDGAIGVFEHAGDILSTPALTGTSPFLSTALANLNQNSVISDELAEWLPQQTLGLLRLGDTPRYVVYCFGQTLRPAANSLVLDSGNYFGLCTNYQVTAENAARAVIRLDRSADATGTNYFYTPVIESFNPLPPQ